MLKALRLLPLVVAIAGCASGHPPRTTKASPPEFSTMASAIAGKDVANTVAENPNNLNPRIRLKPTPGKAPMIGDRPTEMLESNNKSGAYIAFTGQVPVTQYFKVLGPADCDDWVYLYLITPRAVQINPNYYISPDYSEDKAPMKCVGLFHEKYRDQKDARLVGGDGVIFDSGTARFTEVDGPAIGQKKIFMQGWAIKFVDPTPEEIKTRLATKPLTTIDVLQTKAAAYWIETHHASEYAHALRGMLPVDSKFRALNSWRDSDIALLKALAAVDPKDAPADPYFAILEAGVAKMLVQDSKVTVSSWTVGEAPSIAANMLVCLNHPGTVERLGFVLENATIRQHKIQSAKALIALGQAETVKKLHRSGSLGDVSWQVSDLLRNRDPFPFKCPYRSKASEQS